MGFSEFFKSRKNGKMEKMEKWKNEIIFVRPGPDRTGSRGRRRSEAPYICGAGVGGVGAVDIVAGTGVESADAPLVSQLLERA